MTTAATAADKAADAAATSTGQTAVAGAEHVRSIEGISEYRLENGLRVLLFPDRSKPTVTVNLTVFVGSRHEGYGQTGMAHLLEHMLFKGTPDHPEIVKTLQGRGARYNGTTWVDRTNYFETLPASSENLEYAIRMEADRLVNSFVSKEDLESEMTVVRNEFERGENNPVRVLAQRMQAIAYEWHNYGKSTIGNRADIERVPIESLQEFYRTYYRPDNAMLIVSGNFDPEQALTIIVDSFGAITRPEAELPSTYTIEPPQDGERLVSLHRVGTVPIVGAIYHIPAGSDPSYPAIDVFESVMTSAPSGRLYQALVETQRAASVSGAAMAWHDPGMCRFLVEVNTGNEPQGVLTTMLEVVEGVAGKPITQDEVDRAKRKLLKQWELAAANSTQIAIELSEWAAMGDWRLYFLYRDRMEKVTAETVNAVARKYFQNDNRTAGMFLPTEEPQSVPVPTPPADLASTIGDYAGREEVAAGEAFDVSPRNIAERTVLEKLPSGIDSALLSKKNRGNTVVLQLNLRYGNVEALEGLATASEVLPLLMTRGTNELSRQEIQDELDRLGAKLVATGEPGLATFLIQTKHETLPEAAGLLGKFLRQATLPKEQLALIKQAQIAKYEGQLDDPQQLAMAAVRQAIAPYEPGDPRYVPSIKEHIGMFEAVSIDQVRRLYDEFLGGAQGELIVVGDFEKEPVLKEVTPALSEWVADVKYAHLPQLVPTDLASQTKTIATPGKKNAMYFAATVIPLSSGDPDYPALVVGDYILGGSSLSSRLADRVRQEEGLSYGVGSGFNAQDLDDRAVLYMYAITNPANMEKVKEAIREELVRLLEEGITAEELAEAKRGYLQRRQVRRSNDAQLAEILADNLHADRTMEYQETLESHIEALTPEDVLSAMRKHIDPDKFVIVTAGDFSDGGE